MMMRLLILLFCLLASSAWGNDLRGSCQIEFNGTSTLHDFSGTAACQPFILTLSPGTKTELTIKGDGIMVPVSGLDTDNSKRDKKMRIMFENEKFPLIQGHLGQITDQRIHDFISASKGKDGRLTFDLKIRGIEHPQASRVTNINEDAKQLSFDLELELSLKRYHLKPPSFLGVIRVGDQIELKIHVLLDKNAPGLKLLPSLS